MAWLEQKPNANYHGGWRFAGRKYKKSLRTKERRIAESRLSRLEENIALIESGRLELPEGVDVGAFLLSDGKLNGKPHSRSGPRTLKQSTDAFLASIPDGSLESSTIQGMKTHIGHLLRTLGPRFPLASLLLEDLQKYVDKRSKQKGIRGKSLSPATIKKELTTLRTIWNWACNTGYLNRVFPSKGLRFPKTTDKQGFQTWSEITRKIEAYDFSPVQQAELWDCLFLTLPEVAELIDDVERVALHPCIYPMFAFAAHTGARRSEILRSVVEDIDFDSKSLIIREKKRVRGRLTTRSVPLSPFLFAVLQDWLKNHPGQGYTFSLGMDVCRSRKRRVSLEPLTRDEAHCHFKRTLSGTKWSRIRGWHVFRHSFCSNCAAAGVDQRIINTWVGHQTEEMVRRYRHLVPDRQQEEISKVFSGLQFPVPDRDPPSISR